jgi:sugar diacid utilization regulator
MATVDELVGAASLAGLARVTPWGGGRRVARVSLAESFEELACSEAASLVLLSRACSAQATDYRIDMALRRAVARKISAVAATLPATWRPPTTVADIARRCDLALLWVPQGTDLAWLIQAMGRELGGGPGAALERARAALAALEAAEGGGAGPGELARVVGLALGVTIEWSRRGGELAVPVVAGGRPHGYFATNGASGDLAIATMLALHAAAGAASRRLAAIQRQQEIPTRSRGELVGALLVSDPTRREEMLAEARRLGIPVDGWHVGVHLELATAGQEDEIARFELVGAAGQVAFQTCQASGGTWFLTRSGSDVVLVRMATGSPDPQTATRVMRSVGLALERIEERFPSVRARAGIGGAHEGALGLRASVTEARAVLVAARAAGRAAPVVAFDAFGIERTLIEWYASDTARQAVQNQLGPLEALGGAKAETAILTLKTYLDEQGSAVRTARALHLHRNAVTHRLARITALLGTDLSDPDQRLALQLACRARLLAQA